MNINIQKGLNRIALLVIGIVSLAFLLGQIFSVWSRYQNGLEEIDSLSEFTRYRRDLNRVNSADGVAHSDFGDLFYEEPAPSIGWSFSRFKYQEALDAGYSDAEVVAYLQKIFSDFNLQMHKKEASLVKTKTLCWDLLKTLSHSALIAGCLYLFVFLISFCCRWIYRGFKQGQLKQCTKSEIEDA